MNCCCCCCCRRHHHRPFIVIQRCTISQGETMTNFPFPQHKKMNLLIYTWWVVAENIKAYQKILFLELSTKNILLLLQSVGKTWELDFLKITNVMQVGIRKFKCSFSMVLLVFHLMHFVFSYWIQEITGILSFKWYFGFLLFVTWYRKTETIALAIKNYKLRSQPNSVECSGVDLFIFFKLRRARGHFSAF